MIIYHERVWEMPLFEEYKEYLKSDIADLKNTGGKSGSLVSSAYFLYEFAGDVPWVHLDIAGTAWTGKRETLYAQRRFRHRREAYFKFNKEFK